jgi:hypothetical protein
MEANTEKPTLSLLYTECTKARVGVDSPNGLSPPAFLFVRVELRLRSDCRAQLFAVWLASELQAINPQSIIVLISNHSKIRVQEKGLVLLPTAQVQFKTKNHTDPAYLLPISRKLRTQTLTEYFLLI